MIFQQSKLQTNYLLFAKTISFFIVIFIQKQVVLLQLIGSSSFCLYCRPELCLYPGQLFLILTSIWPSETRYHCIVKICHPLRWIHRSGFLAVDFPLFYSALIKTNDRTPQLHVCHWHIVKMSTAKWRVLQTTYYIEEMIFKQPCRSSLWPAMSGLLEFYKLSDLQTTKL